jgi:hypothetical protein
MTVLGDLTKPVALAVHDYFASSKKYARNGQLFHILSPFRLGVLALELAYVVLQTFIVLFFKPVRHELCTSASA